MAYPIFVSSVDRYGPVSAPGKRQIGVWLAISRIRDLLKLTGATGSEVTDTGYQRFTMLFIISSISDTVNTGLV